MDEEPFVCNLCSKAFKWKRAFDKHLSTHTEKKTFFCNVCQSEVCDRTNHLRTRERQKNFESVECKAEYPAKDTIKTHPPCKEKLFICDLCQQQFSSKYHLQKHYSKEHKNSDNASAFPYSKEHKEKLKNHHQKTRKMFICNVCNKEFNTKRNLNQHLSIHCPEKTDYTCSECPKMFSSKLLLKRHEASSHRKEKFSFSCYKCEKSFDSEAAAENHLCDSTKEEFTCDQCNSVFSRKSNLKAHTSCVHKPKKVIACGNCRREFFNEFHLDLHVRAGSCAYIRS